METSNHKKNKKRFLNINEAQMQKPATKTQKKNDF